MSSEDTYPNQDALPRVLCGECRRLLDGFAAVVKELMLLHQQQFTCIVEGEPDCTRFDLLIHMANEKKQEAKYAFLVHLEKHSIEDEDL